MGSDGSTIRGSTATTDKVNEMINQGPLRGWSNHGLRNIMAGTCRGGTLYNLAIDQLESRITDVITMQTGRLLIQTTHQQVIDGGLQVNNVDVFKCERLGS